MLALRHILSSWIPSVLAGAGESVEGAADVKVKESEEGRGGATEHVEMSSASVEPPSNG